MNFYTINPYTQKNIKEYHYSLLPEAMKKVEQMAEAQKRWKAESVSKRAEFVKKISARILEDKVRLAEQASMEMGKPITQAIAEVEKCAGALGTIAELAEKELKVTEIKAHYTQTMLHPEPYGLIFSIQPWNFPYWQVLRMAACALMAGNLIVLKHADIVAGCAEMIEKICTFNEYTFILNLRLTHEDAAELIKSPLVKMITLTGSARAGKQIGAVAGAYLKKQVLELGGSDAYIILPDSHLEEAAKICVQGRLVNSGQSCIAAKRFFIHADVYEKFKTYFIENMKTYKVGDPTVKETQVGPLANAKFIRSLDQQISAAESKGAVFTEVIKPPSASFSRIGILEFGDKLEAFATEEVFGPVASFYKFHHLEQVITAVNNGIYGLGGAIFTQNLAVAEDAARRIETGTFVINGQVVSDARVPFGGVKESGLGREMGLVGLNDFVSWKVVGRK
ncbi:MAG: aldehyde dehydrogenase family protein [Pseudobdellovibrio sp.]